jgi:hypothetical protein
MRKNAVNHRRDSAETDEDEEERTERVKPEGQTTAQRQKGRYRKREQSA